MSSKKPAPQTKSTIYDSMLKSKPYDDPLKKQPTKFQGSILNVMKESPQSEAPDMRHKDPYRSTIYDMIQKHPPVKRQDKTVEERKPIFREDTPPWTPPSPTIQAPPPPPPTQPKTTQPQQGPAKEQQPVGPRWTGITPVSSVGSVSRTLSLFS